MVRRLLDKLIRPACLALGDEAGDLGSSPSWVIIFLLWLLASLFTMRKPSLEKILYDN